MNIEIVTKADGKALAELRALAMKESLEAIGRFDPIRVRERFLLNFSPDKTKKIYVSNQLVAFFVLDERDDHYYLDHLYVIPSAQGQKIGSSIMELVKTQCFSKGKSIKLGALKGSRSNDFYISHGFVKTHEEGYDNYYELKYS